MKAYELLSDESKWATRAYARTNSTMSCAPKEESACSWCVLGAMEKCYYNGTLAKDYIDAVAKLRNRVGNIAQWNDAKERTYEEVIALLKELDI